jgi:hypothetical protein
MLLAGCTSIPEAGSRDEFRNGVVRFSQNLGFDTVSAVVVVDFAVVRSEFVSIDNAPHSHVKNAMHKLGCTSKHQAVLQALQQLTVPANGLLCWNSMQALGQAPHRTNTQEPHHAHPHPRRYHHPTAPRWLVSHGRFPPGCSLAPLP